MKSILVTGGAGYIGSHVCKLLAQNGYLPVTYDNLKEGHEWAVKWGPFVRGDIRDSKLLLETLQKYKPQAVVHLAALTYVGDSVKDPATYYDNNVTGSLSLLDAMRKARVDRIIFSSSCCIFGNPETMPLTENLPKNPLNPYGQTKLAIENVFSDFAKAYGLKSISLRYFNAAGSDPEGEIGEDHAPETHLIPRVLQAVTGQLSQIEVFGTDYSTPDGTCIRDYIHVMDIAGVHLLGLKFLENGGSGAHFFNLGNGNGFSVKEVITVTEKVVGRKIPVVYGKRREGDAPRAIADSSLVKKVLGWVPQYPQLEDQIRHAWIWHQKHHGK